MSELDNMKDLVLKLSNKKRNDFFYDRTDTMSIASVQSSIFDLDSSMTSGDFSNIKPLTKETDENNKYTLPFKTRPLNSKSKKPDNWLYCNPRINTIAERAENPLDWMRTVFDEEEYVTPRFKSNLKQQLSKSHGNLYNSIDYDVPDCIAPKINVIQSHKSVSNLKDIDNLNNDLYDSKSIMTMSKTAPGSAENITDTRSSFQDFVALAKQQEESLKAEVMRRKSEITKGRLSLMNPKASPTMKYLKNGNSSTPRNRFGYNSGEKSEPDPNRSKLVTTRYSKPDINTNKEGRIYTPRSSLQTPDETKRVSSRSRYYVSHNYSRTSEDLKAVKLYHV